MNLKIVIVDHVVSRLMVEIGLKIKNRKKVIQVNACGILLCHGICRRIGNTVGKQRMDLVVSILRRNLGRWFYLRHSRFQVRRHRHDSLCRQV